MEIVKILDNNIIIDNNIRNIGYFICFHDCGVDEVISNGVRSLAMV